MTHTSRAKLNPHDGDGASVYDCRWRGWTDEGRGAVVVGMYPDKASFMERSLARRWMVDAES
jgi:hypothetical protein